LLINILTKSFSYYPRMGSLSDPSTFSKNDPLSETTQQLKSTHNTLPDLIQYVKTHILELKAYLESFTNPDQAEAKNLLRLLQVFEKLLLHLEFSNEVLKCASDEEIKPLKERFPSIKDDYEKIQSREDLNFNVLLYTLDFLRNILLEEYVMRMNNCFKRDKDNKYEFQQSEINSAWIEIMIYRFEIIVENYPRAISYAKTDIYSYAKDSQIWQEINKLTTFKEVMDEKELDASNKSLFSLVHIVYSLIKDRSVKSPNPDFSGILSLLRDAYALKKNPARSEALAWIYLRDPTTASFKLSIAQNPLIRTMRNWKLPSIGENKLIYLPRIFPQITKELILKEYQEKKINRYSLSEDKIECEIPRYDESQRTQVLKDLFVPDESKIQVRIISPDPLYLQGGPGFITRIKNSLSSKTSQINIDPKAIIIHVHGGGWARGESEIYLPQLFDWSNNLGIVIYSIDYRLAPQNQYPAGLDDVWQAYLWILHHSHTVLGVKFEKIILVGDSAGGNLITALTLRLIKTGLRLPNGCFMLYPSFDLNADLSRPSLMKSITNVLLPYNLLKLFVNCYIGDHGRSSEDPFISPLVACDELLEKLPPIRITVGTCDPIEDDTWRFMHRLIKLNKNVKTIAYKGLIHGFYNTGEIKYTKEVWKDGCDIIRELISL